jgi:hypothetical protein
MRSKPCWIYIDGRWWPGYLREWRLTDDGWYGWGWAEWHREPRWFHQRHLRARLPGESKPR